MKSIIKYIRQYITEADKRVFIACSVFIALFIFLNYHYKIDWWISHRCSFSASFGYRWAIFILAFAFPYLLYAWLQKRKYLTGKKFLFLLLISPMIFSLKIAMDIPIHFSGDKGWNNYWNDVLYWPLRLLIVLAILYAIWRSFDHDQPFYGMKTKNINWKPYWTMLLIMVPLITSAATQPDFQAMYPKLQVITAVDPGIHFSWWHKLLFEISYGTDFIGIETFFRGFLILAFIKYTGKDAILAMACFYCTIHFGKPLGECISSYFGGLILGIVVYNTRSIFGGLMVHLGIAWMMEIAGYLAK